MSAPNVTEYHTKIIVRRFDRHELKRALTDVVLSELSERALPKHAKVELEVIEETEGSPPYRVGNGACLKITIDLADKPIESDR